MRKPKPPKLVTVAIFTTITIIFWVFMSLYNIITSTPPVNVDPEILKPLNPSLDQETLSRLEERVFFEEGETSSPIIIRRDPEIPVLEETPTETISAEPTSE